MDYFNEYEPNDIIEVVTGAHKDKLFRVSAMVNKNSVGVFHLQESLPVAHVKLVYSPTNSVFKSPQPVTPKFVEKRMDQVSFQDLSPEERAKLLGISVDLLGDL